MQLRQLLSLSISSLFLVASAAAQTIVLDFEDRPANLAPLPMGYGGVADWGSWASTGAPDPNYPAASGIVKAFSVGVQRTRTRSASS
jgi:hypothetical protein